MATDALDALLDEFQATSTSAPDPLDALLDEVISSTPAAAAPASTESELSQDTRNIGSAFVRGTKQAQQAFFGSGVANTFVASQEAVEAQNALKEFDQMVASNPLMQRNPDAGNQRNRLVSRIAQLQGEAQFRGKTLGSNIGQVARLEAEKNAIPITGGLKEFQQGDWKKALKENPVEVIAGLTAESLPQMAPGLIVMGLTGPSGAMGAIGLSSLAVENSNSILESMREQGADLSKKESIEKFFSDPEKVAKAREYAIKRGVPVAMFDAASVGLAGKILGPAIRSGGAARMAGATAAEVALQSGIGASGEVAGQLASTGKVGDVRSVVAEGIAELSTAPVEIASGVRQAMTAPVAATPAPVTAPATTAEPGSLESLLSTEQPEPAPAPPAITPEQKISAAVIGSDPAELRQQEAIVDGVPAPVISQEGQDTTQLVGGLVPPKGEAVKLKGFHGTGREIEEGVVGFGLHFTPDRELAEEFSKGWKGGSPRVFEADLELSNALRVEDLGGTHSIASEVIDAVEKTGAISTSEAQGFRDEALDEGLRLHQEEGMDFTDAAVQAYNQVNGKIRELLQSRGYDGIVYVNKVEGKPVDTVVPFSNPISNPKSESTAPPEGLTVLEPDSYERLADEPVAEGYVAYQDPATNDIFQVPQDATPEIIQVAREKARSESLEAEFEMLRKEQQRLDDVVRTQKQLLSGPPIYKKSLVPAEPVKTVWRDVEKLAFTLDREKGRLAEAKKNLARLQSSANQRAKQEAAEEVKVRARGVEILQSRVDELTPKVEEAKKAVKGMRKKPRTGEAGFVMLPQPLVDLGIALHRGGVEFREWSRSMLKNVGDQVRSFLRDIWNAVVKAMDFLAPSNRRAPFARGMRRASGTEGGAIGSRGGSRTSLTPDAYSKSDITRRLARWWIGQYGAFPPEIREVMERKNMQQDAVIANGVTLARDMQKEIAAASTRTGVPQDVLKEEVSKILEGQPSIITDPDLNDTVTRARRYIDAMSTAAINRGVVGGAMADTFRTNMGQWLKRYYNAFDPQANWNYDALIGRAWKDGVGRTKVRDARIAKIITDAEAVIRSRNPAITPVEMEGVLRALTDRTELSSAMYGASNTKARKDVSSLVRREKIDPAIRALMGEETNPILRYEKSVDFMAQLLAKHEAQKALRDIGLQMGLFSPKQEGRYSTQMSEQSDTLDVLAGLYTTPEFKSAIEEADGSGAEIRGVMAMLGKAWARYAAESKMAKVPLNPDSWATNFLGGIIMNAGNGMSPLPSTAKGVKMFQDAVGIMRSGRGMTAKQRAATATQRLRDMRARLISEGVYNSNIALLDLEASINTVAGDIFEGSNVMDRLTGAARLGYYGGEFGAAVGGAPGAAVGASAGAVAGAALGGKKITKGLQAFSSKLIGTPDNFWKILGFLDEFEVYKRANPTMPDVEVARIAAQNVRNTRPTYAKVPAGLKNLSRFGVMNSFFQFSYEMFRNTFHTVRLAQQEIRSGKPALQAKGAKRIAGLSMMLGLTSPVLLRAFSESLSGMDEEKQEAFQRSFAPQWDREGALLYTKSKPGEVSYVNPQYLIPYNQIMKGVGAVSSGEDPDKVLENVFDAYARDFLEVGVHVTPLMEAFVNQKNLRMFGQGGAPITTRDDPTGYFRRFDHVLDKTIRPGAAEKARRLALAVRGEKGDYGKEYTVQGEINRSMGLRENKYDTGKSLYYRLRDVARSARNAKMSVSSAKTRGVKNTELQAEIDYANQRREQYRSDVRQLVQDAKTLGVTDAQVRSALKEAGLPVELRP